MEILRRQKKKPSVHKEFSMIDRNDIGFLLSKYAPHGEFRKSFPIFLLRLMARNGIASSIDRSIFISFILGINKIVQVVTYTYTKSEKHHSKEEKESVDLLFAYD